MKTLIYLFALISLTFGMVKIGTNEDTYGCKLPDGRDQCCWVNSNGCCKPPQAGQGCTMAITTCCKKKKCNEKTGVCVYEYSHVYGSTI